MARGDVLLVALPASDRREQGGVRPAVAIQTALSGEPMLIFAPVTSNISALRFQFSIQIEPDPQNGLDVPSVVMVFQMRAIDQRRIIKKIGQLSEADLLRVNESVRKMLDL